MVDVAISINRKLLRSWSLSV